MWRGSWGTEPKKQVRVMGIEITESRRHKEGEEAREVDTTTQHYIADLDNGKWAYGWQIEPIK